MNLGALGAGFGVLPSRPAPAGSYAPFYLYNYEGGQVATEFAWNRARYMPGKRYELKAEAGRPCEQTLAAAA